MYCSILAQVIDGSYYKPRRAPGSLIHPFEVITSKFRPKLIVCRTYLAQHRRLQSDLVSYSENLDKLACVLVGKLQRLVQCRQNESLAKVFHGRPVKATVGKMSSNMSTILIVSESKS